MMIINDVNEREANEIVVFLASKGIASEKVATVSSSPSAQGGGAKYSISVDSSKSTEAMAVLNQNGLPRKKGTTLLDLFAAQGLMSSDKQESIRYQAGLAEQIANMIRKIDGVIDADVQISFPTESNMPALPGAAQEAPKKITAAVYVKHQGILDDPNSHLVLKIKRLVSGSVAGLDVNDVTVISDRSRFTDVTLTPAIEPLESKGKEYVSIWSIILSKNSAARFRVIFFVLISAALILTLGIAWLVWKFYPLLRARGGFKTLFHPIPLQEKEENKELPQEEPKE
ncbi:MAG: type secretion periplasmic lipoprotein [Chlamydiota bacterium]|jgi:type III secretion protein J